MREYLQLTRAHTAPLEVIPAVVGASLAVGGLFKPAVFVWGFYGFLYHITGYGHNSLEDWKNGYDRDDPNKDHHPLNSGSISPRAASVLIKSLIGITSVYALALVYPSVGGVVVLIGGVTAGIIYNKYGKRTHHKYIFISIAHTTVFILPYVSLGGSITSPVFILCVAFVFLWVLFQIAYSGEVKDIMRDEENYLTTRGADTGRGNVYYPQHIILESISVKCITGLIAAFISVMVGGVNVVIAAIGMLTLIAISNTGKMIRSGPYKREDEIKRMSVIEMITSSMLVLSISPLIGYVNAILVIGLSIAWVFSMNKYLWDTITSPQV